MQGQNPVLEYLSEDMQREYSQYVRCHEQDASYAKCAIQLHIHHLKQKTHTEALRCGYKQMAHINRDFAESGFDTDMTSLNQYENILTMRNPNGSETW